MGILSWILGKRDDINDHPDEDDDDEDIFHSDGFLSCLLYTSPSPRDRTRSRMPSSA